MIHTEERSDKGIAVGNTERMTEENWGKIEFSPNSRELG